MSGPSVYFNLFANCFARDNRSSCVCADRNWPFLITYDLYRVCPHSGLYPQTAEGSLAIALMDVPAFVSGRMLTSFLCNQRLQMETTTVDTGLIDKQF